MMEDSQPYTRLPAPEAHRTSHECLLGCVADWGIYPRPCWVPEGSLAKIFGPVLLCFKPEIDPGTPLDRRGFPGTSLCTKNRSPKLWQPQLLVAAGVRRSGVPAFWQSQRLGMRKSSQAG